MNKETEYCAICRAVIHHPKYMLERRDYAYWRLDERRGRYCCNDCYFNRVVHMRKLCEMLIRLEKVRDEYE